MPTTVALPDEANNMAKYTSGKDLHRFIARGDESILIRVLEEDCSAFKESYLYNAHIFSRI